MLLREKSVFLTALQKRKKKMLVEEEEVLVKWKSCGWKEHRHTPSNDDSKDFFFVLWQSKKGQSFCLERMIGNDLPFHLGWDFQPIPLSNEMCAYHLIRISRRDYPFAPLLPSGSVVADSFPGKNTINIGVCEELNSFCQSLAIIK